MKKIYIIIAAMLGMILGGSCTGDLDQKPVIGNR